MKKYLNKLMENQINKKILFVFDFDHTIVERNSDHEILPLLSENSRKILSPKYEISDNWANYMQEVYKMMKADKIEINQIKEIVENLEFNKGYKELFDLLRKNKNKIDTLIISGANTLFLQWALEKNNLTDLFPVYYSNWANPDEELVIKIHPHHTHDCEECDKSQCKKIIIKNHFKKIALNENDFDIYKNILYAGDGNNDYCAGTILREQDILFPRANFPLAKKLFIKGQIKNLKCQVHLWEDAYKIIEELNKLL
jgi:pyridoxal phosphate phosphatase PHOSPHO2